MNILFISMLKNKSLNVFLSGYTCTLKRTQLHFTLPLASRYRKCERIEKAKTDRILKPFKRMSFIRSVVQLKLIKTAKYLIVYKINPEASFSQSRRGGSQAPCQAATM